MGKTENEKNVFFSTLHLLTQQRLELGGCLGHGWIVHNHTSKRFWNFQDISFPRLENWKGNTEKRKGKKVHLEFPLVITFQRLEGF